MSGPALPDWVKPGASYWWKFKPGNINHNRVFHVRAIVDGEYVVVREWMRLKGRWNYTVEHAVFFDVWAKNLKPRPPDAASSSRP